MALTFFGPWQIEVLSRHAAFSERFVIGGIVGSDGAYPIDITTKSLKADGTRWTIELEWNNNAGSGWLLSDVRKIASTTLAEGLAVILGADDDFPNLRDGDFNDAVVRLRNLDPVLNPWLPFHGHPAFSVCHKPTEGDPD